ncbi:hypothetical protein BDY19DRAFT_496566 [Irpex rosettiformis]|uniref:Uncharacterized protein n=1 Tax=Irpex rosettiformis TaxID=378272 RepID=A0ACB8UEF3_9APHY|nr:hypothetical protein BDY19DRAFT_496566 [Irpex rosettiformis]
MASMDATAHEEQTHDDDADGLDDCYYDSGQHPLNNVDGPEDTGSASVDETSHRPPQAMHLGPATDIEGDTSMHLLNPNSTLQHTRAAYTLPPFNSPDSQYTPAISVVSPIALPISSSPVLGSPGHPDHPAATMSPPASKSPVSPSSSSSSPSSSRVTLDAHRRLQSTSAPPLQTFSTSSEISTSARKFRSLSRHL